MLLLDIPLGQLQQFLFVLARVGAILFSIPFLDARNIPVTVKAALALAFSIMLMPHVALPEVNFIDQPIVLALGLAAEIAIGLIIGLTIQLLFSGVQMAGQLAGFQMGFAIANVMDPTSSLQIPILSQFLNLFALLIFFTINAHYYFIRALADSFVMIPAMSAHFDTRLLDLMIKMGGSLFVICIQVGAPVMVALLLTNVALGLAARTVPQMQIFIVAMPLQILLGLLFLGLSMPFIMSYLTRAFNDLGHTIVVMIGLFK